MTQSTADILPKLIELSKVDLQYARVRAEKNQLNEKLVAQQQAHQTLQADLDQRVSKQKDRAEVSRRQEKHLQGEQEKLVARRKSLNTLNDYKLQEKAGKEIEHASKLLSVQEDKLVELMDEVGVLAEAVTGKEAEVQESQSVLDGFQTEVEETFKTLDGRIEEYVAKKSGLEEGLDKRDLNLYNRIAKKYPGTAVVPVEDGACSGCYFSLGQQVVVNVSRGKDLVSCPSCGRILFLSSEEE